MTPGSRTGAAELFIYWKTGPAEADAAIAALAQWQRELSRAHPGLQARVYLKDDGSVGETPEPGAVVTLMETYAHPQGIGAELAAALCSEGERRMAAWMRGARHVERFVGVRPGADETPAE